MTYSEILIYGRLYEATRGLNWNELNQIGYWSQSNFNTCAVEELILSLDLPPNFSYKKVSPPRVFLAKQSKTACGGEIEIMEENESFTLIWAIEPPPAEMCISFLFLQRGRRPVWLQNGAVSFRITHYSGINQSTLLNEKSQSLPKTRVWPLPASGGVALVLCRTVSWSGRAISTVWDCSLPRQ